MPDFNVRSDSVNVEQIMEQIRARIREKRGVDYTEQQIRELAAVKLEKFLDPRGVRSDLLEQFRRRSRAYTRRRCRTTRSKTRRSTSRIAAPLRWIRQLLQPILKLFFNPNPLIQALHIQSQLNTMTPSARRRDAARHRPAALRGACTTSSSRRRDRHRGQEPEDARRVADRAASSSTSGAPARSKASSSTSRRDERERAAAAAARAPLARAARCRNREPAAAAIGRPRGASPLPAASRRPQPKDPVSAAAVDGAGADGGAARLAVDDHGRDAPRRRRRPRRDGRRRHAKPIGGRRHRCRRAPSTETARIDSTARTATTSRARSGDQSPARPTPEHRRARASSEARGRRSALRPGNQRRRRAARALHRRASRPARRGRGPDDVRHRLRDVAQRAAGRRRDGQRRVRCAVSVSSTSAIRWCSAGAPSTCSSSRIRSPTSSTGSTPKGRPARRSIDSPRAARGDATTTASSSATATTTRTTARARRRRAPSWCRPPNATPRSVCRYFGPIFRGVRALMYNSPEERAMIQAVAGNQRCRRSSSASARKCPRTRSRGGSARSSTSAARSPSTSAASTRTRAARSCSSSSRATCATHRAGCRSS